MKKLRTALTALLLIAALAATAYASTGRKSITVDYTDIKITVDGELIDPRDVNGKSVEPFALEGTTYVPVRAVSEALGAEVSWNGESHTVELTTPKETAYQPDTTGNFRIGQTWRVEGLWEVTVTGVTEAAPSSASSSFLTTPKAVYIVDYTFRNLGYTNPRDVYEGLYIDLGQQSDVLDAAGLLSPYGGYTVSGTQRPGYTPVGHVCSAQAAVAVDAPGPFQLFFTKSVFQDDASRDYTATFYIEP